VTSPGTPTGPGPRFTYGESVTVLITAEVHAEYEVCRNRREVPAVSLALPPAEPGDVLLEIPYGLAGVTLVRGDVIPTIVSALKDAVAMREPDPDCVLCALVPGSQCGPCGEDARMRAAYGDVLEALKGTSGGEGEAL
jgi:hypothetical protein